MDFRILRLQVHCRPRWARLFTWAGRPVQDENGQSLVITALFMTVFMGMLGLVIDVGHGYASYRQMQMAADAAALAGVRELAMDSGEQTAVRRMEQLLADNGADATQSERTVAGANRTEVVARRTVQTYFAAVLGLREFTVEARSAAIYGQVTNMGGLLPLAVERDTWSPGQNITLWSDRRGPANYGWVRWSRQVPSTSVLRANIDNPHRSDDLRVGDSVLGHPGVGFSSIRHNLNAWVGRTVLVFLYDSGGISGAGANLTYPVEGFAAFRITSVRSQGRNSEIRGEFLHYVSLGEEIDPTSLVGVRGVALVE
jgi:Flp pilus assembly protein TadG